MTKTKHTPGPWTYDREEAEIRPVDRSTRGAIGRFHAGRQDGGNDARPILADGRLMAAAPELLAACELALDYLSGRRQGAAPAETLDIALRAAIAKAATGDA